jgi:uncharacterized protein
MNYTIDQLREKHLIVFEAISGSHAYGTSTPDSDKDIRGVFIQPLQDVLKYGFVEQVADEKNDIIFYEVGRFVHLLIQSNPNILELLNVPDDCLIYCHSEFKRLFIDNKHFFITKKVRNTFAGYAINQIQKARGYNKKMNWEEQEMKRKTVLDFCYVLDLETAKSVVFNEWLEGFRKEIYKGEDLSYKNFGLSSIDHSRDLYAMYVMWEDEYAGIVSDPEKANDVQLISIPKDRLMVAYLSFNKDGYTSHCIKYKEYQTWLKERNPNRVKMNKAHGKNYDSKNLMHCMRLLDMVIEMLDTKEIVVRRPQEHIDYLMKIRRGEMEYEEILSSAEEKIAMLDEKTKSSVLPEKIDEDKTLELLKIFRNIMYNTFN